MKVKVGTLETRAAGKEVIICVLSIDTAFKMQGDMEPKTTIVCFKITLSLPLICIADYVNYQNVRDTQSTCVPKHSSVQKNLLRCRNRVHRKNNLFQSLQNILIDNLCIKCC